ncbi:MAG: DNA/RNA non-specific endonuclease [Lachnospiraceae bacterium]|nr:DNA/RNA non-specific endonuclease [Lachnospiraceae bacterium]
MEKKRTDCINRKIHSILLWICVLAFLSGGIVGCAAEDSDVYESEIVALESAEIVSLADIPDYSGTPYMVINENIPFFDEADLTTISYEFYSELDSLGRCGVAVANISQDIMPTEERGAIGPIKPTGWHTVKYDGIDGNYLYNRCHLIGYQLSGENANEKNLITGTRYLNVEGMLPYEDMVVEYVQETDNHVLYRVTPIFDRDNLVDNLVANGVQMEAVSVEDNGDGVQFNIYCYNVQPGIVIDYATGDSYAESESASAGSDDSEIGTDQSGGEESDEDLSDDSEETYILNTNTKKFHYPSCSSVDQMSEKNKQEYTGSREDVISMGYEPCKNCNP